MEKRRAGKSGLSLSRLGLGTMTWGRDTDEHEAADQCRAYLDAGGNFLDTAALYGDGDSERLIGGLIGALFKREEVVIATKAGVSIQNGERSVSTTRQSLMAELDRSLNRLGTEFVDLWQVHTWDATTPLDDTLSALDWAYTTGRARYVGVCNYSGWQSSRVITGQGLTPGRAPIATLQNEYSLLNREIEREVLPCAIALETGVLAWSPLGRGVLTGKYRNGTPSDSRGASPHLSAFVEGYMDPQSRRIVDAVAVAAEGLGYSPLEVALAWVRDTPGITSAIIGARTGAQLRGALRSEEVQLPEVVRRALADVSER
jgi:aryl-alcohol dehydrogenase-like predicted oxidoreductase